MKSVLALAVCLSITVNAFAFVGSSKAAYIGGSTKERDFPGAKKEIEGFLDTSNEEVLRFTYKLNNNKESRTYSIPYNKILDVEYGQKAGRRVGAAAVSTILLGPIGLLFLLSKKRKHYTTIGYTDETGKEQVAVFELGKDIVRTTLPILEARSGKKIEYQDESAKKASKGK